MEGPALFLGSDALVGLQGCMLASGHPEIALHFPFSSSTSPSPQHATV